MKSLILALAIAAPGNAPNQPPSNGGEKTLVKQCTIYKEGAAQIMLGRQKGVSLERMMEEINKISSEYTANKSLWKSIVLSAYKMPRYRQESLVERAVEEFSRQVQIKCLEAAQGVL